jgi:hypothetical protein
MKLNNKFLVALVALCLFAASCKKALEEQKPQASLDAPTAFANAASVRAGLFGIYSAAQGSTYWGLEYLIFADLAADNLTHVGTFPTFAQIANKQILPDNVNVANIYNQIYDGINRANTLIAAIPGVNDASLDKDATLAEARTLRAMMYFDLLRYWGGSPTGYNKANGAGVVLKLTPTLKANDAAATPRSAEAQVWAAILADLDYALGITSYPNRITNRAGKDAARALKARVQLYREQWADAEALATEVINSSRYQLVSTANYESIWLQKNSTESIFELEFNSADQNSIAFYYYTTGTGGRNEVSSSTSLRDAHETGDIRRAINYTTACTSCTPPYPAAKTRKYSRISTGDDNVILIRLAEIYLIRAEARARQAASGADIIAQNGVADLNIIRQRAGLTPFVSVSKDDIQMAILRERRVELAHEGHRWFDLRRYNMLSTTLGVTQPFRALWPIPQSEVLTSGGVIAQNDQY